MLHITCCAPSIISHFLCRCVGVSLQTWLQSQGGGRARIAAAAGLLGAARRMEGGSLG